MNRPTAHWYQHARIRPSANVSTRAEKLVGRDGREKQGGCRRDRKAIAFGHEATRPLRGADHLTDISHARLSTRTDSVTA